MYSDCNIELKAYEGTILGLCVTKVISPAEICTPKQTIHIERRTTFFLNELPISQS